MQYQLIDHTADFGIRVWGKTREQVYENAALALSDLITDRDRLTGFHRQRLLIAGDDRHDLMFNWLREILYLWHGKERLVQQVRMTALSDTRLEAEVAYDDFLLEKHEIKNEIKAVTYHQLAVNAQDDKWEATIILDV